MIQLTPVKSGIIRQVGYDPATETLVIEFHKGTMYEYTPVGPEVVEEFLKAPSVGSYFHTHIRDRFSWNRVR